MALIPFVNVKQGSQSQPRFSRGNTLPLTQLPFAMAGFTPQTDGGRGNWFYHPDDRSLEGVRLTHQPSPWVGDYGHFLLMPQCGEPQADRARRWSGYRPEEAVLRPDYLQLDFLRYQALLELTPAERGAVIRLTFRGSGPHRLAILPITGECGYRLDASARLLTGFTNAHSVPMPQNFRTYFALRFDCPMNEAETYILYEGTCTQGIAVSGDQTGIFVGLGSSRATIRLAISYISEEQAIHNLEKECGGSFEEQSRLAAERWENILSSIEIEPYTKEQKRTFYSCLYRMHLYPHKFYELNGAGEPIHYDGVGGGVKRGVCYTDNGFWDTYRTVYPLLALTLPDAYAEILEGFVQIYRDTGWLPRWPSGGEMGIMPGTLIDAVIAEAAVRGVGSPALWEEALEGMLKHATTVSQDPRFGRRCVDEYRRLGYIPRNKCPESVNHTLDAAYGDFCIAQVAAVLGKKDVEAEFRFRSGNYRHLFDPITGFMRGRDEEGRMAPDFDAFAWGGEYTEGGPWQNSFAVYHDVNGLAALYGGREKLIAKLDELFAAPPLYHVGGYGFEIHEMSEMAALDFGQCAISNQPSFHLPYLYAALGAQEKTNYWVQRLAEETFSSGDGGFPGDEDNGTAAGWYIFSSLGFYPLCPGKDSYVPGIQLLRDAKINGHRFRLDNGQLKWEP